MKVNVTPLMSAIERYIAKADDNLEEKLSEEGYVNAAGAVKAINDLEDSVRDALEEGAESLLENLKKYDDVESFMEDVWSSISTSEELKEVLKTIFRKKFDEMLKQFTFEWILSDAPDYAPVIDDERITKPAEQFIKDWSQQLADIMNLTTKDSIERILLDAQEKGWSIDDTAKAISDSDIRQPGYRSRRVALTEVLRIESYAQQEAMVQNPLAYAKKWKHVLSSNPRENHMAINGQQVFKRKTFTLTGADGATYRPLCPRDTSLPASESVNCHCLMEMVADESALGMSKEEWVKARSQVMDEVDAEWESKISIEQALKYAEPETIENYFENLNNHGIIKVNISSGKQFGKKSGKHCIDYGLDPSSEEGRTRLKSKILDIVYCSDEVRIGSWRGQSEEVLFYIRGEDAVLTQMNGDFITIMKGAAGGNARVKNARKREI